MVVASWSRNCVVILVIDLFMVQATLKQYSEFNTANIWSIFGQYLWFAIDNNGDLLMVEASHHVLNLRSDLGMVSTQLLQLLLFGRQLVMMTLMKILAWISKAPSKIWNEDGVLCCFLFSNLNYLFFIQGSLQTQLGSYLRLLDSQLLVVCL